MSNARDLMSFQAGGDEPLEALLPRRKIVVAVGIDGYKNLPTLRCAVSDALGVQELLVGQFGFEAPRPALTNQAATKQAIEALVEDDLRKLLGPDDALVLFFAGHGTTRLARLDTLTVETGYIAPVEARGPDVFSDLIDMGELLRKIGLLPARHILVVLDACHSGMALGAAVSQYRSMGTFVNRLSANRSRRVIMSARRDELALDSGPVPGHSLFTGTLIQALTSGRADLDNNGVVTFSELAWSLQKLVGEASGSRQTPDYGAFHLDDRGELVLAMPRRALSPMVAQPVYGRPPAALPARRSDRLAFVAAAIVAGILMAVAVYLFAVRGSSDAGAALLGPSGSPKANAPLSAAGQPPTIVPAAGAKASPGAWKEITSASGGFKVQLPGVPLAGGNTISATEGYASISVGFTDRIANQPVADLSPTAALDAARDAKIAGGSAVLSEVRIAVGNKYPGRDLVFNFGRTKLYERHFVAKQRLYMLGVHDGTGKDVSALAQKFFATFELTE